MVQDLIDDRNVTKIHVNCDNEEIQVTTLPNTGGLPQEQSSDFRNQTTI